MNVESPRDQEAEDRSRELPAASAPVLANRGPRLLNRISLLLAFVGIFAAGVLSIAHAMALSIPCGESGGCDVVASSQASQLLGIPVAYLGLLAYVVLAAITSVRALKGFSSTRRLGYVALGLTGVGATFSLYLQFVSLTQIHAYCLWCIASAVTMSVAFLVQAGLAQMDVEPDQASHGDVAYIVGLGLLTFLALGVNSLTLIRHAPTLDASQANVVRQLVTTDSITLGNQDAPIKLIEFSDLMCPSCRAIYPQIKQTVETSNGKVQLIFRHFPLYKKEGHEMALPAAFVAEYANEKGKAWKFIEQFYLVNESDLRDVQSVLGVAQMVGLDVSDIQARMKDADPAYQRVTRDIATAKEAGINSTPTFVILAPGQPAKAMLGHEVMSVIHEPAYQKIIGPNGG